MSHSALGLEIRSVRRARVRWPLAGSVAALAGLALMLWPLAGTMLPAAVAIAIFAGLSLAVLWAGHGRTAPGDAGWLRVDGEGRAFWTNPDAAGDASALLPERWQCGASEIWLRARMAGGMRVDLRARRPSGDDRDWRALRRWLVWLERGGPAAGGSDRA